LRRFVLVAFAALFILSLLAGIHFYVARRLILDPALPQPWRGLLLGAVVALGASLLLQPIGERGLSPRHARWITWPAALWMGLAFLLLLQLVVSDALLWLAGRTALASVGGPGEATASGVRAAVVAGVALVAGAIGLRGALRPPRLVRLEIPLARWPRRLDGFRIVQISDIHIGPLLDRRFARSVVERVNALAPDLVAVTGDLVDGGVRRLADEVAPFAGLRARCGVYFVTGNHDHYSGARAWAARAAQLGMRVLRNERVEIRDRGEAFDLVGVDDHRGNLVGRDGGEDLGAALSGRDPARPAVLLAHDPTTFRRASRLGIDLQLSGHTHGGQIWPFGYLVRLAVPWVAGRHRRGAAELYVSRGTGFWGPPMRLLAPAEITEIVLRAGAKGAAVASLDSAAPFAAMGAPE
jgi:predicted MPP superfamily phosphohydrolase